MIVVLILVALALFGIFGMILIGSVNGARAKAEKNSESILDETFDGSDDVTFTINMSTLKYETVINGAKKRGYKLAHETSNQYGPTALMFERA